MAPLAVLLVAGTPLRAVEGTADAKTILFAAGEEWKTVDMGDVRVRPGSALDLSGSVEPGPAGKHGRVIARRDGTVGFAERPDAAMRFFGFVMVLPQVLDAMHGADDDETRANLREFAAEVRREGYNMVRLHIGDTYLMGNSDRDLVFDPVRQDRLDCLFAALKQEGIYTYLDIGGYGLFYKGTWRERVSRNTKLEIFCGNPDARENWRQGAAQMLAHLNPYTQTMLRDDPAVVCVNFYNEQELGFHHVARPADVEALGGLWHAWLGKRYPSLAEAARAWGDPTVARLSSWEAVPLPPDPYGSGPKAGDYSLFLGGLEAETQDWYRHAIDAIGYRGLICQYDVYQSYREGDVRAAMSAVSMHGYYDHPTAMTEPGSRVAQDSSVGGAAGYFRGIAAARLWDKPFFVTEHAHCFWNQYEREGGLLFGAYAALQDFQAVLEHSDATLLRVSQPMDNFSCGRSPIGRANQVLAHQLYLRGDVAPSPHRVEVSVPPDYLQAHGGDNGNPSQTRLGLVAGFGVRFPRPDRPAPSREPDLLLAPAPAGAVTATDWAVNVTDAGGRGDGEAFSLPGAVAALRRRGVLPPANRTDVAQSLFQSDTGEITLAAGENRLSVITPRTEGVTLADNGSATLSALAVQSTSVGATVAVTSLDDQPLRQSRRLLLLYLTDSANTGMELSEDRTTLVKLGSFPPLLRAGTLTVSLDRKPGTNLEVWALGIDGARGEPVPSRLKDNKLEITVNTGQLKNGPTPFFEIVAK